MMATTHALAGLALAALTLFVAPEYAPVAALAGVVGGVFPDLDLYAGHRRTLHFPVYFSAVALATVGVALVATGTVTVALAVFLAAAALHSVMDAFGGGLELRPWLGTSERAVYDHFHRRWIPPRRWVRYDGAPEDLALAAAFAVPSFVLFEGIEAVRPFIVLVLALSAGYVLLRKWIVDFAERLVATTPTRVLRYIPERFVEDVAP